MPNRAHMQAPPEEPFARARWFDARWEGLLRHIPLTEAPRGWAALGDLERRVFPPSRPYTAREWLGGSLDPACPACGVETEDGTVELTEDGRFHVVFQSCGHEFLVSEADLRARVRHAGDS